MVKGAVDEINVLKKFLSFPTGSTYDVFAELKTIDGHVFREENSYAKKRFLYMEGKRENKALLVAHADTSYGAPSKKHEIIEENGILKAVDENGKPQLLGADDRAGVAMLWLLKDSGHSLLVTDGEERSLQGSKWLMEKNLDIADRINLVHQFMIQLDRRNGKDFKCYNVGTDAFRNFIAEKTGYKDAGTSSYSDISTLCKSICGVNFSVGYYKEHTNFETLNLQEWLNTLRVVKELLTCERLPKFQLNRP